MQFLPSTHKHAEYKLKGDVLRRLQNMSDCSAEEFSITIKNHVETRHKLFERVTSQLT
jgi:hypothetical protein